MTERPLAGVLVVAACLASTGCASSGSGSAHRPDAVDAYYAYDFATARAAVRRDARRRDEQVLLNQARLGLAALADGDLDEAEAALEPAFDLLSTPGLNQDRNTLAVLTHERVRICKGEPFEQALLYHYVAVLYACRGDWENVRAASVNALRRLEDFDADRVAAGAPVPVPAGYRPARLLLAIATEFSGAGDAEPMFAAIAEADGPDAPPVTDAYRAGAFDTLLVVDYGKGPTKVAWGPDWSRTELLPQEQHRGPLLVTAPGAAPARSAAAGDVDELALDYRWDRLAGARQAKSVVGEGLVAGGHAVAGHGHHRCADDRALAGLALIAAGLVTKASASADVRYLEYAPQSTYLVPMTLGGRTDLLVEVEGDPGSRIRLLDVEPGTPAAPRTIYLRLHGLDGPDPGWLAAPEPRYGNDFAGVRPGDYPWILGGEDVSTPSQAVLDAYQAGGHLPGWTLDDLVALYTAEGIVFGAGARGPGGPGHPAYRHVLEGGRALFTPAPWSVGYKRIMCRPHRLYRPRSGPGQEAARRIARPPQRLAQENVP